MVFDKKRATNRLLFALSRRTQGMTTRELAEFINKATALPALCCVILVIPKKTAQQRGAPQTCPPQFGN